MRVLLDVNVILDVLLEREEWRIDADVIWKAAQTDELDCCVAASSLTDVFYIARRFIGQEKAKAAVGVCLEVLTPLTIDQMIVDAAFARRESDFEDAIQIVVASVEKVDAIITRDAAGFNDSPIAVMSPADLASRLQTSDNE